MISLKAARILAGLTQQQLAVKLGVDQTLISKLEVGKRKLTVEHAVRLSALLSIDPIDLLELEVIKVTGGWRSPTMPAKQTKSLL